MGSSSVEVPRWLKRMPLAPEFRPTDTEFADPIAYISKIEKEASAYGICKIIPPLPKPSKRYVFHNLNETLSKCPELGNGLGLSSVEGREEPRAVFTTRQQELGQGAKRAKGAVDRENQALGGKKHVWQSGEAYTLEQFESKSKVFLRSVLGMVKEVNPLVIEALFWKAASEKPIYVEYANDVPGSGFAEPEGQFQYFRRRRRKRASYQSYRENRGNSDSLEMETKSKHAKDGSTDHNDANPCPERSSSNASMSSPDETTRPAKKRSEVSGDDMVGTAGWKLSNSPWNLQVIARSPGSLTRFMPDDIPGVTSPMVYIGMLFSWFAWHVEDHELHSLNFLHTGSPKTWYAVPGEHAQTFEEAIRSEVYGGNVDRLAALTSLGEKTTLLSPEAIVSSGITCCRLVQNPGEFVVTFPRAYHVGFSHGFNCGEAANFGTPQWLEVAKDAAVRRAAMNYLPMLSHQQLMYLLTMSFVSRVPRSLLPGVRCSRLRDRQREDRELSVKKVFLEDVLKESQLLSCLLAKNSAYYAVTWNADLLPCATRETQLPGTAAANVNLPAQDATHMPSDSSDGEKRDLVQEMSLYMETLNGLYVEDDDDLSTDFQMDSGSLACVACGILGFPFMCVIQPSKQESLKHPSVVQCPAEEDPGTTISHTNSDEGCACLPHLSAPRMNISTPQGWSTSCRFLRPRIFCLEHGTQIEQLLRSKGGANLLVICHSDYQKIKAHISAIAEEISVPCNYHDGSMDIASQEELNLIDLAIDDNIRAECGEDWTSAVGINLRFCVKMRKRSPSQQVQHALALGGLFSEENPRPRSYMKWKSKRSRSRVKLEQSTLIQPSEEFEAKRDKVLPKESTAVCVKQEKKLIQYSRRKFKERVSNVNMRSEACQGKQSMAHQPTPVCGETSSGIQMESCAATSPSGSRTSENNGMLLEVGVKDPSVACSCMELESSDSKEVCAVPRATSSKGDLCSTLTLDGEAHEETQTGDKTTTELHLCNSGISIQSRSLPVSVIGPQRENLADNCLSYDAETHPESDSAHGLPGNEVPSIAVPTEEDLVSSSSYQTSELVRSLVAEEDSSLDPKLSALNNRKRKREVEEMSKDSFAESSFIKSPCEGLRPRATKSARSGELHVEEEAPETTLVKSKSKSSNLPVPRPTRKEMKNKSYKCDLEGCRMCFRTKTELSLHKRNQCPYEGCRKRFSSHNYAMVHQRVHEDDRPLKCPWEGCSMSFKWAWARTEHLRVHTGEKPYQCKVEGCGLSFRFVSDFSRHRRRTGHHLEAPASP